MTDERHHLLQEGNAPGKWSHQTVAGGFITYSLPVGVSIETHEVDMFEVIELVLCIHGNTDDSYKYRQTEVLVTSHPVERDVLSSLSNAAKIDERCGVDSAAEIAYQWMKEFPGVENE